MRKTYLTDLSDGEWTRLRSYLPTPKAGGRPRTHALRDVLDAIFYVLKSGCQWRLLPHDFPPWSTVYYHFRRFRLSGLWFLILKILHTAERKRVGKNAHPTAAILDSQSVKTVEESAHPSGYDAHKNVKGRKRHLLVDTLGFPLSVYVTSADVQDRVGAQCFLAGLKSFVPRLKKIWADGAYTGEKLAGWCQKQGGWELETIERSSGYRRFRRLASQMDRGADAWMVDAEAPFKQRLRAAGADQRKLHRGRRDPLDAEATHERSMNLQTRSNSATPLHGEHIPKQQV